MGKPIGLLAEAYSLRWVLGIHGVQFGFDVAAAAALLVVLAKVYAQRVRVMALAPAVAIGARVGGEKRREWDTAQSAEGLGVERRLRDQGLPQFK